MTSICDGCKEEASTYSVKIPGRGSVRLCVFLAGQKRAQIRPECFAKLFVENCILCTKPHGYDFRPSSYGYSFTPLCKDCLLAAQRGMELEKKPYALHRHAVISDDDLTRVLAEALGSTLESTGYCELPVIGGKEYGYIVQLTEKAKESLVSFVDSLNRKVKEKVARGKQEGHALLVGLASGEYTIDQYDSRKP